MTNEFFTGFIWQPNLMEVLASSIIWRVHECRIKAYLAIETPTLEQYVNKIFASVRFHHAGKPCHVLNGCCPALHWDVSACIP